MPTGGIPIPVLSTVNFKNFLTASSSKSNIGNNDQIIFLDKSNNDQLCRIRKSDLAISAAGAYKGVIGSGSNYNNSTESGYYTISAMNGISNQPNWSLYSFTAPGVLQVRTNSTDSSTVTTQIATAHSNAATPVEGYFIRRIVNGSSTNWTFVLEDFSKNPVATTSTPGIMSTAQVNKLNSLTTYAPVTLNQSNNGLMTTSMLSNLNTAYSHAASKNSTLGARLKNFYQIAINEQGHIIDASTFGNASSSSDGLMSANSYSKLTALTTKTATSSENGYMSNKQYQKLSSIQSARLRFVKSSSKQWVDLKAPRSWFLIHGYHVSDSGASESLSACHIDRTGLRYMVPIFSSLPSGMVIKTSSSSYSYTESGTTQTGYYVRIERNANDSADYYLHFIGFENMPVIGRKTEQVIVEPNYIDEST